MLLTHPYINALYPESKEWWESILRSNRLFLPADQLSSHPSLGFLFVHHDNKLGLLDTISQLIESASHLFASDDTDEPQHTNELYAQLYEEALFRIHQFVSSFRTMLEENTLNVKPRTLVRLMQRAMKQASIPFHGEPAIGLQVMGVLETRNLDFKRIILLSTNEGKLPKKSNEASFIPYNLREAFGMTTLQRQNAVYAYYFYRMIQRAEHVTIVYNDGTDGMNKQEPSRYVMQLQVEFPGTLSSYSLQATTHPAQHDDIRIGVNGIVRVSGKNLLIKENEVYRSMAKKFKFKNKTEGHIEDMTMEAVIQDNTLEIFPFIVSLDRYMLAVTGVQNMDMSYKYHASVIKSPLPVKLGVDIYGKDFDHMKFKVGKAKYKNSEVPNFSHVVDQAGIDLQKSIMNVFDKGVDATIDESVRQSAILDHKQRIGYVNAVDIKLEELSGKEQKQMEDAGESTIISE